MKAPDKIYTCYNIEEGEKRQLWSTVLLSDVEQVGEYIRKDALLEWLEELNAQSLELREAGYGDVFYSAQIAILEETIHKIESL